MEPNTTGLTRVWEEVEAYLQAEQLELDDLELVGRGRSRILRVLVDGDALDLDRIADVSRGISRLLDGIDTQLLADPYQLEISSPGLERKLTRPRHFEKSVGREVIIKTADGQHRGTLVATTQSGVTIALGDDEVQIAYPEVVSARTVFTWEKPPKPGERRTS